MNVVLVTEVVENVAIVVVIEVVVAVRDVSHAPLLCGAYNLLV